MTEVVNHKIQRQGSEQSRDHSEKNSYVLVTAAYNEEKHIAATIESIVSQIHKPLRWVIVSDFSSDRTDQIVSDYASRHDFITLHRITKDHSRNFMAQVHAINTGISQLAGLDYGFIGNLDADITLGPSYFVDLLAKFGMDRRLGLAGGFLHEKYDGQFQPRKTNSLWAVPHGIQLFRRECFTQIGGAYRPLPYGGPDWHAEVTARMQNWKVQSFSDVVAYHHRPTGSAEGLPSSWYRMGRMDYSVGSHPIFELFKIARRVKAKPYVMGALIRFWAFCRAYVRREERCVSPEFVDFLQREQLSRVKDFLLFRRAGRS